MIVHDYHGQLSLEVLGSGPKAIRAVLGLIANRDEPADSPPRLFYGYKLVCAMFPSDQALGLIGLLGQGPEWLVLWGDATADEDEGAHPFLVECNVEDLSDIIDRWLHRHHPEHAAPGIDGTVRPGAFHAKAGWHVQRTFGHGAVLALTRVWAVYGK